MFINTLETEQDIEKYKSWLETKSSHVLKLFIKNFERDLTREEPWYVNHKLRIELVSSEIKRRLN